MGTHPLEDSDEADDIEPPDYSSDSGSGIFGSEDSDSESGLDAFKSDSSSGGGGGGGNGSYPHQMVAESWQTKLDYGKHYVMVAEDRQGNIRVHQDTAAVLDEHTDWRRLEDAPDREMRVIYTCRSRQKWLRFCSRAQNQLDVDPQELLENDPVELAVVRERVHYPNPSAPDQTRECRVCGTSSDSEEIVSGHYEVSMLEIDLQKHRRVPVCSNHTVAELAENGLLE